MPTDQKDSLDAPRDLMSTREVAEYLRIKERKVYDLLRAKQIPCTRVGGKWLFPRRLIDDWVAGNTDYGGIARGPRSASIVAGSHDPLLDWALRESRSGFALQTGGSLDGLKRLAAGEATVAGMHIFDRATQSYNVEAVRDILPRDVVLLRWALREQGLIFRSGERKQTRSLKDVAKSRARLMMRQEESGGHVLLVSLLEQDGLKLSDIARVKQPALNETDLGHAIADGKADVGLGLYSVARQFRLEFLPLQQERFDLAVRHRDYFELPMQKLMAFARTPEFAERALELGGYDIKGLGEVIYNGE